MKEDDETLVATLQLLLGDADTDQLFHVLTTAFGGKMVILPPRLVSIQHEFWQAEVNTKRAREMVSEPPLGRLACRQIKQELDAVLGNLKRLEDFLGNPKR